MRRAELGKWEGLTPKMGRPDSKNQKSGLPILGEKVGRTDWKSEKR